MMRSIVNRAGRNFGHPGLPQHDERYEIADEYLEVCCKLWEASWEDGAVIKDRQHGIYADREQTGLGVGDSGHGVQEEPLAQTDERRGRQSGEAKASTPGILASCGRMDSMIC